MTKYYFKEGNLIKEEGIITCIDVIRHAETLDFDNFYHFEVMSVYHDERTEEIFLEIKLEGFENDVTETIISHIEVGSDEFRYAVELINKYVIPDLFDVNISDFLKLSGNCSIKKTEYACADIVWKSVKYFPPYIEKIMDKNVDFQTLSRREKDDGVAELDVNRILFVFKSPYVDVYAK